VERLVTLLDAGKNDTDALQTVNDEARKSKACNVAIVMFTNSKPVAERTVKGIPVSIVEITIHAVGSGSAWKQVPGIVQYTAIVEDGVMI